MAGAIEQARAGPVRTGYRDRRSASEGRFLSTPPRCHYWCGIRTASQRSIEACRRRRRNWISLCPEHRVRRRSTFRAVVQRSIGLAQPYDFLLARLIPSLLGLVTTAVLTRLLEPAEYGLYALGLSIIFFLTIGVFEWLGLSLLRVARTAEQPDLFFGTVLTCFRTLAVACTLAATLVLGSSVGWADTQHSRQDAWSRPQPGLN